MAPRQRKIAAPPQEQEEQRRILIQSASFESSDTVSSSLSGETTAARSSLSNSSMKEESNDEYRARTHHDYFNLVALLFIVGTAVIDWDFRKLLQGNPTEAFRGDYFFLNWATTSLYFLVDLVWVCLIPICVKSPDTIIKHHLLSIIYLLGPVAWPDFRWVMGACLSVEINTWFLILRRVLYKSREKASFSFLSRLISACFYVSWIVIRVFLYPAILIHFIRLAHEAIVETKIWFHWPMLAMPVHLFLCVLNIKWTYELFAPIVKDYLNDTKNHTVSNGL